MQTKMYFTVFSIACDSLIFLQDIQSLFPILTASITGVAIGASLPLSIAFSCLFYFYTYIGTIRASLLCIPT